MFKSKKIKIILLSIALFVFATSEHQKSTQYYIDHKPNFKAYVMSKKATLLSLELRKMKTCIKIIKRL